MKARTINNGQSCIAAKRFIVHEKIAADFERRFVEAMARSRSATRWTPRPTSAPSRLPPSAPRWTSRSRKTVAAGAKLRLGGRPLDRPGNFYAPTVLADVPAGSPGADEEIFGPVASLFAFRDLDEGIALANRTRFGLGASAWTKDRAERDHLVSGIEAGAVFVNGMVKSDPRLPFGGVKHSGFGRELSQHGIREFVNVKTVWVA